MKLNGILVCDAVRLNPDAHCDIAGSPLQRVVVDPHRPRFTRTVLLLLSFGVEDIDQEPSITLAMNDEGGRTVFQTEFTVRTSALPPPPDDRCGAPMPDRAFQLAFPVDEEVAEGLHRIIVTQNWERIGQAVLTVVFAPSATGEVIHG